MNSAIYTGWVRHRRREPVEHVFRYRLFMMYLDLAELDTVFRHRWLWSARRPALAWFRRRDHLGDPTVPLDQAVRDLVEGRTGRRPDGPIRLLTHLRYFGIAMNPVSFYYCFDQAREQVDAIVAEVHNTPWGERHCYVLDTSTDHGGGRVRHHVFPKAFHVSPFMPMEQTYDWRLSAPGRRLLVHMTNIADDEPAFDATMVMTRHAISARRLAKSLVRYPLMTGRVVLAIYHQALRLKLKGCPFHEHPRHRQTMEVHQT